MLRLTMFVSILISSSSMANETFMQSQGGSIRPTSGHTCIVMKSEVVKITFGKNSYTVDGEYIFSNPGEQTAVTMGFPISSGGVLFKAGLLKSVSLAEGPKTWVEGKQVPFVKSSETLDYETNEGKTILLKDDEIATFKQSVLKQQTTGTITSVRERVWYTKDVFFPENRDLVTRVFYKAHYGESSNANIVLAQYIYGSGGTWSGCIKKATFVIRVSPYIWMISYPRIRHDCQWRRNGEYEYELTMDDLKPDTNDELLFNLSRTFAPYMNEWGLLEPPITETELSLCSLKQLQAFRECGGTVSADVVREFGVMVDDYSKKIVKDNYRYVINGE